MPDDVFYGEAYSWRRTEPCRWVRCMYGFFGEDEPKGVQGIADGIV